MSFAYAAVRGLRRVVASSFVLALVLATSCRRPEPQTAQAGYGYPPPQGQSYPPPQPRASMPPAFGFYCATDNDVQCPFGRCLGGRCGGCQDNSHCKPGAACIASAVGMTCWPGAQAAPQPQPQPQPLPPRPAPVPPAPPPNPADPFAAARQSCVDRINAYRARVGARPVARAATAEPCADEESRLDAASNRAHGTFGRCREMAQNACPNYPGATTEDVLASCLQQMFDEGPGGGHYDNMTNPSYTTAWCGFAAVREGRIWAIQNFR